MSLEEILSKKTDVERQLEECLRREQDNQAARDNLQKELEDASDYILELEEKGERTSLKSMNRQQQMAKRE